MKALLRLHPALLLLAACCLAHPANGQTTYNYSGPANSNWSSAANWTPAGVPGSGDSVVQTTSGLGVRVDANEQISALTLNATNLNILGSGAAGSTTLTVSGAVAAQTGILTLRNSTGTLLLSAGSMDIQGGTQIQLGNSSSALGGVTVSGDTTLEGSGSLLLNAASANFGTISFDASATGSLILNDLATASAASVSVASLSGSGATSHVYATNTSANAAITGALTLTGASGTATYAGKLQDNGSVGVGATLSLTKTGGSTQILSGATNTYSGGTTVSGGALLVANTAGSGIGTGMAQVNNGGTLGGTGIIALGAGNAITVASGGFLLAGDGTATGVSLTVNNAVTLGSGSVLEFVLGAGGAHSTLARAGGSWTFAANQQFDFINLQAGTYSGLITGLGADPMGVSGWTLYNGSGYSAIFSYNAASGGSIDVSIAAIPEPAPALLLLFAATAAALGGCRFRRVAASPS